ncbi:hypothetical protein [Skermanella aerolata]
MRRRVLQETHQVVAVQLVDPAIEQIARQSQTDPVLNGRSGLTLT